MSKERVGVAVTTMNLEWSRKCLPDLLENTKFPYVLYLADDETTPESREWVSEQQKAFAGQCICTFTDGKRQGIAASWNDAVRGALDKGLDYLVILNNDVCFPPVVDGECWLEKMVKWMDANPEYGFMSAAWPWYGQPEDGGFEKFKQDYASYIQKHKDTMEDGGFGYNFILRLTAIKDMIEWETVNEHMVDKKEPCPGLFDSQRFPCCWEEVDLLFRMRRLGWKTGVTHSIAIGHAGSRTTGSIKWGAALNAGYRYGHMTFCEKWGLPYPVPEFRVSCAIYHFLSNGEWYNWDGALAKIIR